VDRGLTEQLSVLKARSNRTGIFLDFDGTLSPIVDDPVGARPLPGVVDTVNLLARRFAVVAIVSGRPVEFLNMHLDLSSAVRLRGLYGLQRLTDGVIEESASATRWRDVVANGAMTAEAQLPSGIRVERKGLSFVLHYRRALALGDFAEQWAARFAHESGLDAHQGRSSIEIGPFHGHDKGEAVTELCEGLSSACVIGDDLGDIAMFHAVERMRSPNFTPVKLAVESPELPDKLSSIADAVVPGPDGVLEALRYLAR
jgi:trehalose 6-phosphate phosphatase